MNTVLLSVATPDTTTHSATASRSPSGDSTPQDNTTDFAGVLASQATPPPQNTRTSAAGNDEAPIAERPRGGNGTGPDTHHTPQGRSRPAQASANQDAANAAQIARLNNATPGLADPQSQRSSSTASAQQHTAGIMHTATDTDADADAQLPERFSQIIAAMSKVTGNADDGKGNGSPKLPAASDTDKHALAATARADALKANPATPHQTAQATWQQQIHTARNASRADASTDARTTAAQGKFTVGMAAPDADPISFSVTESHRIRPEGNLSQAAQNIAGIASAPEHPGNPATTAGAAFSLVPATPQGSDAILTSAAVNQSLHSKQWAPEFGRQFISLVRPADNGNLRAELRLDPPELGPLRITININDSVVQALFTSSHATVRNAVEHALPQLQQQLEQEGLSLGQASVSDDGSAGSHPEPGRHAGTGILSHPGETDVSTTRPPERQRAPDALVDTFA